MSTVWRCWWTVIGLGLLAGCGDDPAPAPESVGAGHWAHVRLTGVRGASGLAVLGDTLFVCEGGGSRRVLFVDVADLHAGESVAPAVLDVRMADDSPLDGRDDLLTERGYTASDLWTAGVDLQGFAAQPRDLLFLADRRWRVVYRGRLARDAAGRWSRLSLDRAFTVLGADRSKSDEADYSDQGPGIAGLHGMRGRTVEDLVLVERGLRREGQLTPGQFRVLLLDAYGVPTNARGGLGFSVGRVPAPGPADAEAIVEDGGRYLVLRSTGSGAIVPLGQRGSLRTVDVGAPSPAPKVEGAGQWRGMAKAGDGTLYVLSDGDPAVLAWRSPPEAP